MNSKFHEVCRCHVILFKNVGKIAFNPMKLEEKKRTLLMVRLWYCMCVRQTVALMFVDA